MKFNLKTIAAIALMSAFIPAHAFVAVKPSEYIYGLNRGDQGGGIYRIDATTGDAISMVFSTPALAGKEGNGLAYDAANNAFYYTIDEASSAPKLYRRDNSGETLLGSLSGSLASASWRNGKYYYVQQSTRKLHEVSFSGNAIQTNTVINMPANLPSAGYGDIAFAPNGLMYGASDKGFYVYDLSNNTGTLLNANSGNLQIGFYGSALYGVQTNTDKVFSISLATGAMSQVSTLNPSSHIIQDAASAVPEPTTIAACAMGVLACLRRRPKK